MSLRSRFVETGRSPSLASAKRFSYRQIVFTRPRSALVPQGAEVGDGFSISLYSLQALALGPQAAEPLSISPGLLSERRSARSAGGLLAVAWKWIMYDSSMLSSAMSSPPTCAGLPRGSARTASFGDAVLRCPVMRSICAGKAPLARRPQGMEITPKGSALGV